MNANDLIDSYVADVARLLPRRQRDDVAFELRALLAEELEAKATSTGREPDAAMARELLGSFGRPAEVAARYRPAPALIDPEDTRTFVRASAVGMAIWWVLGLVAAVEGRDIRTFVDVLLPLQDWWLGAVLPSLWWPGFLLVCFAVGAWARRHWPQTGTWKPRPMERERVNRVGYALAVFGMFFGMMAILEPSRILDMFFAGRAAPEAYAAFTYDDGFLRLRAPLLLALLIATALVYAVVALTGRWTAVTRRADLAIHSTLTVVMAWVVLDGPVVRSEPSDRMIKGLLVVMVAIELYEVGKKLLRDRWRVRAPSALDGKPAA